MHFVFGSKTSQDFDILVVVEKLGNLLENKKTVIDLQAKLLNDYSSKPLNVNIGTIKNGVLTSVFKGTVDEVNNSIIDTYNYHDQKFPLMITNRIKRDIDLKTVRTLRVLLSLISRTEHREKVKKALKGSMLEKHQTLSEVDFSLLSDSDCFGKKMTAHNLWKTVAFQLGQNLALYENIELYSKEDIAVKYPSLSKFLQRQTDDLSKIENLKKQFLNSFNPLDLTYQTEPKID